MRRPVAVEPVKAILATPGCSARYCPATAPSPGTMFTTPSGNPTSAINSATRRLESGVSSAGFITTQFPAASAGAIFQLVNMRGKFQGATRPTTPSGSRGGKVGEPAPPGMTGTSELSPPPPEQPEAAGGR